MQNLPPFIEDFLQWLIELGFSIEEKFYDAKNFGNWLIVVVKRPVAICMILDRSFWDISIAEPWLNNHQSSYYSYTWHRLKIWQIILDRIPITNEVAEQVVDINDAITLIKQRLPEIECLLITDNDLSSKLKETEKAIFRINFPGWSGGD